MIDKRLLRVDIEVGNELRSYTGLDISASGSKVSNSIPNEFTIKITNLNKTTRDKIITESNILNRNLPRKKIYLYAGRESTGYSLIFQGDIRSAVPSQPSDIGLTIQTYTGDSAKYNVTVRSGGEMIKLSILAKQIANKLGLNLVFEATDKQIGSYSYSGSSLKEVEKLAEAGGVNAYIDDDRLIVKNNNQSLKGYSFNVNINTGMIGIPEITELGIKVKILFDAKIVIGSQINVSSTLNPIATGRWNVFKITYDLQNRAESFYMTLEATKG